MLIGSVAEFPQYRPVAEHALLVEFGEEINTATHDRVLQFDRALSKSPFEGFVEAIPAYASVLVCFDPLLTDHAAVRHAVAALVVAGPSEKLAGALWEVEICYDQEFATDLARVAEACGLSQEEVISAHSSGDYKVYMYGFAPGYAYMAGVPPSIQLPRKQAAVRDIPAGSVLIAGSQCLVTTLKMPTGWWIIGRSPTRILNEAAANRPFLFDVGDSVRFQRISRAQYESARHG
ncbi:inhibitor of KinA [Bradyrhizobium sp. USDA 4516]